MSPSDVILRMRDGTAVFCQHDGCEKPALYLFRSVTARPFCAAHCSEHAREFASRLRIEMPPTQRWPEASS
jgi:hypothetical protein